MPFLLRGLDLPDVGMRINVIITLLAATEGGDQAALIAEHSSTLVTAMLANSKLQEPTSMVRMLVAACDAPLNIS